MNAFAHPSGRKCDIPARPARYDAAATDVVEGGRRIAGSVQPDSSGIFLSYRREDTRHVAGRLSDWLVDHFGENQVFLDVDTLEPGLDFARAIADAVGSCQVLLAVIGDRWLDSTDRKGRRKLDDPDDLVRLELEAALERDVRVIPVLVDGVSMPGDDELPPSLVPLARRHAFDLSYGRFRDDARRLVEIVDRVITTTASATQQDGDYVDSQNEYLADSPEATDDTLEDIVKDLMHKNQGL
jgi:hypothetical protein